MSGPLRLVGEEYFKDPWKNLREVMDEEADRLTIDLPPQLTYDRHPIPLHVLEAGEDLHLYSVKRSGVVILSNQSNGQVRTGLARTIPPPPRSPAGFDIQTTTVDLRTLFAIPRTEERYAVALIVGPYRSGPLPLEMLPASTEWRDPAIAEFLRQRQKGSGPRPIGASGGSLRWMQSLPDASPEQLAAKSFIEMQVPRVVLPWETPEAILKVRFRLPIHKFDVFAPTGSAERFSSTYKSVLSAGVDPAAQRRAIAGVPISLVIVDSLNGTPKTVHIHAPVTRDLEPDGDALMGAGGFELDLLSVGDLASRPRTYFIYAASGQHLEGPAMLAIVDQARI